MSRKHNIKLAGKYKRIKGDTCVYCGAPSDTMDHVPPVVFASSVTTSLKKYLVPCCKECNCISYTQVFLSVDHKRVWLKAKIASRYKKILNSPDWSEEDLADMEDTLRLSIISMALYKKGIQRRLDYIYLGDEFEN